MQEAAVTVGGVSRPLPAPFFVLATQNPIEMEGTYPLPEAQLDRFLFKLRVRYPGHRGAQRDHRPHDAGAAGDRRPRDERGQRCSGFRELIREVPIADARAGPRLDASSWPPTRSGSTRPTSARRFVRYGASPRGAQALVLGAKVRALAEGRFNVSVEDLRALAAPALRHRIILNFEGEAEGIDVDTLIAQIVESAEAVTAQGKEAFLR